MARTRSARNHSPAAVLDPPVEPTVVDPAPPTATSPSPPLASLSSPRRKKRPVEPKAERIGARKKVRLSAIEVGGDRDRDEAGSEAVQRRRGGQAAQDGQDDEAERLSRVGRKVTLGDGQQDYTMTCPLPWRDSKTREFHFDDYPDFRPNMSPEEIIRQGSFDGGFFRPVKSQKSGRELHEDWSDFPKVASQWYDGLDVSLYLTRPDPGDTSVNKWQPRMGQPFEAWEKNGWLRPEHDARGWFSWYYRFYLGRRCDDDARQVQRWAGVAGNSGRFKRMLLGKYRDRGVHFVEPDEELVSPGIRQTLNHWCASFPPTHALSLGLDAQADLPVLARWAYDPTTAHLNRFREEKGDRVANDDADE
ncbi:hypothetical protein JCM9279_000421 [Rhodotorula babjevae]